ncbi:PREDICTED: TMV resistance protein N-like [Tarenaya hassleriana]|uniref:TMV resistance protein N-like n=1 Tax=Tarenaya hassleriana TaxID=28532 RepID=UPI0008FD6471|nr:PREDICTED: TMV resistance protein N-like [Tarenaya hassleriana]
MEKVMGLLDFGAEDIRVVGIWGMGGIGKTTLAEALFDQISGGLEGSYFFRNVRETEEKGNLVERRNECLSVILGENLRIGTSMLPSFVVGTLRRKRVLVVLDDVNHQRQLEILFKGLDESSAGSRVIITTRDKHLLSIFPKDKVKVYDMEGLNNDEALQLFCRNAYVSGLQTEGYDELAMKVVHYASGIPLALKVFACSLRGRGKHEWESALNKLGKVANMEISNILKVSYDGLEDREIQNIFLDIACFFKEQDKDHVTGLLDGCYHAASYGLSVLDDKALINLRRNMIEMPDPLQELGWDIVIQECESEPGRRTRLWRPDDVHRVLKRNNFGSLQGTEAVKGIYLDLSKVMKLDIKPDVFEKMYNLRLLKFDNSKGVNTKVCLPHGLESLPDELRYLCWPEFPLKHLPSEFCPENLVELDMRHSTLNRLWSGAQNLGSLKILNLDWSEKLKELPDLSGAQNLERIDLYGCCQIDEFPKIPKNIQEINMGGTAIREVPSSIQHLSRLVKLNLFHCKRLEKLPDTLSNLESLEDLTLSESRNIKRLPALPRKIKLLDFDGVGVVELSPSIGSLHMLSRLDLRCCGNLMFLPSDIWKMQSLKSLSLSDCSKLEEIPEVLESNECLKEIMLIIIDNPRNPMDSNTAPGNEIPAMDIDENPHIAEVTNPVNHDVAGTDMNNQVPNVANVVPLGMPSVVANSENQAIPIVPIGPAERPEQFKGQNFKRWQQKMLFFLTQLKLSRFMCWNFVLNGLDDSLYGVFSKYVTAKQLWEAIDHKYRVEEANQGRMVVAKLLNYRMIDTRSVVEQVDELQIIFHNLAGEDIMVNERFQVATLIEKLPPSWTSFKNDLRQKPKDMSLKDLHRRVRIRQESQPILKMNGQFGSKANVVETTKAKGIKKRKIDKNVNSKKFKGNCYVCGKTGHLAKDCYHRKEGAQKKIGNKTQAQ